VTAPGDGEVTVVTRREHRRARIRCSLGFLAAATAGAPPALVDRPCAAGPHRQVSRDRPTSSSACRQILGVISSHSFSPQPDSSPARRGHARGEDSLHCRSRTIFHGAICSGKRSRSTPSARAARVRCVLIALIETEDTITKILSAMGLPTAPGCGGLSFPEVLLERRRVPGSPLIEDGLTEVKARGWQRRVKTVLVGLGRTENLGRGSVGLALTATGGTACP